MTKFWGKIVRYRGILVGGCGFHFFTHLNCLGLRFPHLECGIQMLPNLLFWLNINHLENVGVTVFITFGNVTIVITVNFGCLL